MVSELGIDISALRKSGRVFARNASIGANGATIWRARLDRPLLTSVGAWLDRTVRKPRGPNQRARAPRLKERLGVVI